MKRIVLFGAMFFVLALLGGCVRDSVAELPSETAGLPEISAQAVTCSPHSYSGSKSGTLNSAVMRPGPVMSASSIACPLGSCTIIDFFGARKNGTGARMHYGIDLRASPRTPVKAVADGYIESVNNYNSGKQNYGYAIVVRHKDKFATMYAHLDASSLSKPFNLKGFKYNPKKPINVRKGQVIAYSGDTFNQKPHLHLEYIRPGQGVGALNIGRIDPLACLESVEPIIKAITPATPPLKITANVGQTKTGIVTLLNTTSDEIILDGLRIDNGPALTLVNPQQNWITSPEETGSSTTKENLTVKGTCSKAGTFNGTVSMTFYKGLNNGKHTKGWPIPTNIVDKEGFLPKPVELGVRLTCKAIEKTYRRKVSYGYSVSDTETKPWYGYPCGTTTPTTGTSTIVNRSSASATWTEVYKGTEDDLEFVSISGTYSSSYLSSDTAPDLKRSNAGGEERKVVGLQGDEALIEGTWTNTYTARWCGGGEGPTTTGGETGLNVLRVYGEEKGDWFNGSKTNGVETLTWITNVE